MGDIGYIWGYTVLFIFSLGFLFGYFFRNITDKIDKGGSKDGRDNATK
jgi:hypothetical protein